MKGGYKIIDFKSVSLSGTPVTMADVLVDLLNNYDKVVLLSNVVLSGSAKDDCFSTVLSDGAGGVKLNCYDGYITINSSGAVTYVIPKTNEEITAEIGDLDDLETTDKSCIVKAINETKLSVINGIFTPESGITIQESVIKQYGKVVNVKMVATASSAFPNTSPTVIGRVSGVSIPNASVRKGCVTGNQAYTAVNSAYSILSTNNGDISIRPAVDTDKVALIDFTYIVD